VIITLGNLQGPLTKEATRIADGYTTVEAAREDKATYTLACAEEVLDGHPEFAHDLAWKAVGIHRRAEELRVTHTYSTSNDGR
jgi:hypothetical protein